MDISRKLIEETNHHSGDLAELLEGAASEIDLLRDEKAELIAKVERLTVENETIKAAAVEVVSHMEGRQPARGWLRDNDKSRDALNALFEAVRP